MTNPIFFALPVVSSYIGRYWHYRWLGLAWRDVFEPVYDKINLAISAYLTDHPTMAGKILDTAYYIPRDPYILIYDKTTFDNMKGDSTFQNAIGVIITKCPLLHLRDFRGTGYDGTLRVAAYNYFYLKTFQDWYRYNPSYQTVETLDTAGLKFYIKDLYRIMCAFYIVDFFLGILSGAAGLSKYIISKFGGADTDEITLEDIYESIKDVETDTSNLQNRVGSYSGVGTDNIKDAISALGDVDSNISEVLDRIGSFAGSGDDVHTDIATLLSELAELTVAVGVDTFNPATDDTVVDLINAIATTLGTPTAGTVASTIDSISDALGDLDTELQAQLAEIAGRIGLKLSFS